MKEQGRLDWRIAGALAGWAVTVLLVGNSGLDQAMGGRDLVAKSLREALAGCAVLGLGAWRGERLPGARGWGALLLLAGVSFAGELLRRPYVDGVLHVHYVRAALAGTALLLAPLWLALLAALRLVPDAVPRRTVGATLAGLAGYCLLLPGDDLTPRLWEVPALLLYFMQAVATVWMWSYARRVFTNAPVLATAGCGLLVLAVVHGIANALIPNDVARSFPWGQVWGPLAMSATAAASGAALWYWLLTKVELALFSMQACMVWLTVAIFAAVVYLLLSWRMGLAVALGLWAMWSAVRARVENDEPVRLDIAGAGLR